MDPLIGGALISGVSGLFSGLFGNNQNKDIAQMNNEFNERMLQKQMDYNTEMYERQLGDQWAFYNDQKEYNSAAAQVQRYKNAGINPAIAMSGQGAGVAQSMTAPSAQGITPPTATPYSADYSSIPEAFGNAVDALMKIKMQNSQKQNLDVQTDNMRIEGKYLGAETLARIAKLKAETKSSQAKTDIDRIMKLFLPRQQEADLTLKTRQAQQVYEGAKLAAAETLLKNKQVDFLPIQVRADLAEQAARTQLLYSQNKLTKKQVEHEVQKMSETAAKTSLTVEQARTQSARTINERLENTTRQQQNEFNAATYKNRVRMVREQLFNIIYDTDKFGGVKTLSRIMDGTLGFDSME